MLVFGSWLFFQLLVVYNILADARLVLVNSMT